MEFLKDLPHSYSFLTSMSHITAIRQEAQQLKNKTKEALTQASKEIEQILLN